MRIWVATAAAACMLVVVGGAIVANAGANITSAETITVLGTTTKEAYVDNGEKGFGPGDTDHFVEKLTNESDGSVVGTARIQCTVHIGNWGICMGSFTINGRGEIVGEGQVPFRDNVTTFDVPITGGTGEFANVRGVVHVESVSNTKERHTLDLLP